MFSNILDFLDFSEYISFLPKKYYGILILLFILSISLVIGYFLKIIFNLSDKIFENTKPIVRCFINKPNFNSLALLISIFIFKELTISLDEHFGKDLDLKNIKNIIDAFKIFILYIILRKSISNINSYTKQNYNVIALNSLFDFSNVILLIFTLILCLSIILNVSTYKVLGTLGALTAVIVLVFRDILLGFITGLHIYQNKVFQVGDWIELHSYNADGEIISMNLISTKILNWDKTMTVIPTHSLINTGIKNWDNISKLNIRRMKRSILIDLDSIKFLSYQEIEDFKQKYNCFSEIDSSKNITNLLLFRTYLSHYLKQNKNISNDYTCMIRELQSTNFGLPLEIYCFTNTYDWNSYENITAEIIEYTIASSKYFKIKIFESPRNVI